MLAVLDMIGRSLFDGLGMFWQTLWALVLGFGLSGAVQAFVSREEMQRALGDHRPATIARAGFFGAVSSSCSYAASALAKSLFSRGADFTAAQAFMFASTNLVVELGLVLWLLIGWQFAAAEFAGGAIMIAILVVLLPLVTRPRDLAAARDRLNRDQARRPVPGGSGQGGSGPGGSGLGGSGQGGHEHHGEPDPALTAKPWRQRIRSLAGWSGAAGYTISDLTMVRRELIIGFTIAGFADAAVPVSFWQSLFLTGHGFWSALENVVLGPFLAIISFVCSIGNVPLAAALWAGGSTFGGVIAFVFADLIALPLLLIYRRYYGTRLTLRLLGVFWLAMSLSGLAVEYLFSALGIAPHAAPGQAATPARGVFGWNYTTFLDLTALAIFGLLYWLYRNRDRFGGGSGYAKDPVCGMQVATSQAPARTGHGNHTAYFCSDRCQQRFLAEPSRYARPGARIAEPPGQIAEPPGQPIAGPTAGAAAGGPDHAGHRAAEPAGGYLADGYPPGGYPAGGDPAGGYLADEPLVVEPVKPN
jgi:hypothetical protein